MDLATVSARRLTGRVCSTPFAQDTLLALRIHKWNNPAKATDMGCVGEVHLRARVENGELVDKQILCHRCGDQQRPQALCWSVLSAESPWPSLQRRQRWSKTWPKCGAGLDRTCSTRRQRQNSFTLRCSQANTYH